MQLKKLKNSALRTLPDGLHSDGGGLYLRVRAGSRSWIFRYQHAGKRHDIGLGSLDGVTLTEARRKADDNRIRLRAGETDFRRKPIVGVPTINDILEDAVTYYVTAKSLRGSGTAKYYTGVGRKHLAPIGNMMVTKVTRDDIAKCLLPIWSQKSTSKAVRHILRMVYMYALFKGYYTGTPPCTWQNNLELVLPKSAAVTHHRKSCHWKDIPAFYKKVLELPDNSVRRALAMCILMPCRPSELFQRLEGDVDRSLQVIVAPSTKTIREPVFFPYPKQAEQFLKPEHGYLFCAVRKVSTIGETTLLHALQKLGDYHLHGFRASFSTWCADNGKDPYVRERVLTHAECKVAQAYQRSDLLERRRALVQEWADYVTQSS